MIAPATWRTLRAAAFAAALAISAVPLRAQPFADAAGELAFNNACRTCHSIKQDDNRLGPSLHRLIGRRAGSVPGFAYSAAMRGADIIWDETTLDRFLANPDAVVAGNRMKPFGGIAAADVRAKIIAYLRSRGT